MKIAVTGGAGFIGSAVLKKAAEAGHEAWGFDLADGNSVLGDLRALSGADVVIHLAGMLGTSELFEEPETAIKVNMIGSLHVLQWCQANGAGYVDIVMPDSNWANVYQATKLGAMRLADAWHANMGVPVSHVRAFNVYGAGQKHGDGHPQKILPMFATEAYAKRPLPIWGNGLQCVDLIHVDDVADMLVRATRFGDSEVFDAGTGMALTVNRVAETVNRITGNEQGVIHLDMRKGEVPDTVIIARGEGWDRLGWKPDFNPEAFSDAVESYAPWAQTPQQ